MRARKVDYYVGDFETTVYDGQDHTEVWASALVKLYTEDAVVLHSIDDTWQYLKNLSKKTNLIVYYHNLKFDGSFWLVYFLSQPGKFRNAYYTDKNGQKKYKEAKQLTSGEFITNISNRGLWYTITVCTGKYKIEFRDSLKLLPFSVKQLGKSFGTKHKKLSMEYKGERYAGCTITDEEKQYIINDVLVVKEALEIMFDAGHKKLTIGACCLSEYKTICRQSTQNVLDYKEMFPDLKEYKIDGGIYGDSNADAYIRRSYKGGWCYLAKGKENKVYHDGVTADVNSLYPSMMSSESGNDYPVMFPIFWHGDYIPYEAELPGHYFFIRIRTRFYLKKDRLPFLQNKTSYLYKPTEMLEDSDIHYHGKSYQYRREPDGSITDTRMTLTLTQTDYKLLLDQYNLVDFEILDGCFFYSMKGIFDEYINKYAKIKMTSKGAKRTLAKLFLNNLYGKMAVSDNSSFKIPYLKEDGALGFISVEAHDKDTLYIPAGSAITSYARNFTIRAAQANYHGKDKPGFIYADTDSIHCDLMPDDIVDVPVDPVKFCHWKLESSWDRGYFVRQKTYIEHVTAENLEEIDEPYYNIKCAGMPETSKKLFEAGLPDGEKPADRDYSREELNFLYDDKKHTKLTKRKITDFSVGLKVPGKLVSRQIPGGQLLIETDYEMR